MAKLDPVTIGITLDMLTITTTGPKVLATVKGSNPDNIAATALSALSISRSHAPAWECILRFISSLFV